MTSAPAGDFKVSAFYAARYLNGRHGASSDHG